MICKPVPALLAALVALTAAACAKEIRPIARDLTPAAANSPRPAGFQSWQASFRVRALNAGIRADVFDAAFVGVGINQEVRRLDNNQAEFTRPIWDYLDTAVSDTRVENGRGHVSRFSRQLDRIEATYGVDREAVIAIWGMETNYGSFRGSVGVIEALATLAYDGRRRRFAEEQLIAALSIIQSGDVSPAEMRGSWAGAMGHTQFIPTSYLAYAQDFNGDGRRDVWSEDPTDALASAANYLRAFGWRQNQPWGVEVRLPQGFNYGNIDLDIVRPVSRWTELGVRQVNGAPLRDHGPGALLAPAGANGPVFLVFNNFKVIKRYNNANSYAIGVGHLASRIGGSGDFVARWPRTDRALSRSEKMEIQQRLNAKGFDAGEPDGLIGANTIAAIRAFQRSNGLTPDGYASADLLRRLR